MNNRACALSGLAAQFKPRALRFTQLLDDGQAKTGAFLRPRRRIANPAEAGHRDIQFVLRHAGPAIDDRKLDATTRKPLGHDANDAARRREAPAVVRA